MAATAQFMDQQVRSRAVSLRWIIGAREDLIWFIGSVASSYLLLVLYVAGIVPLIPMVAAWAILVDAPHVFGTLSRTYFDTSEWNTRKRLMLGSLLFFVVGPAMVLLGFGFTFFFLAALWAYYHLVKQHYGFMVLYKKKNNDLAAVDNALDRLLLLFAFNYPFVAYIASDPAAMERVPPVLRNGVNAVALFLLVGTVVLGTVWIGRQLQRAWLRQPLNVPKYLLLAASIPMHWIALLTPMPNKPIALVAILTIYHNLQYHRLIWFHNQKYSVRSPTLSEGAVGSLDLKKKYGPAALISRRLIFYVAFGILFGLMYQGPRQVLGYMGLKATQGVPTAELPVSVQLGVAFLWGVAFIHYYLDSKIWRVRRDPSVGQALKMD
ncbi:MAG TPA: hypothetical protein VLH87_05730 [Pyrinomonadaceae bacterium]|nr:hypothetical protein [Pyrinomonadaceae bacterium]